MDNQQPQSQSSQPPQDFYSERSQRANKKMIAVVVIVSALSALGVAAYQYFAPEQIPEQIACTQDAKQCPDGSYVFRQAPNCEFALCSNNQNTASNITILSPNGGEKVEMGKTYDIKWSSNTIKNLDIRLIEGTAGAGDRYIAQNIPNSGSYSWAIPDCRPGKECSSNFQIPAGQYRISIHEVGTSDTEDISDAPFSIVTSQDSTANWQIYRNSDIGFEFKYPTEWKIDQTRTTPNEVVFDIGVAQSREAVRFTSDAGITIEQRKTQIIPNPNVIIKESEISVAGERALVIETSEFGTTYIIFRHSNIMYVVTTGGRFIEEGIISTLKYTK